MLAAWKKSYEKPRQHIKKQRHHFAGCIVCRVRTVVFLMVMYGWESWAIKKAEHWRTDVFKLWCWRRLLRVPWTARRSNHSILKEINPEYSLEGLMLKLKLQYSGHLMSRTDYCIDYFLKIHREPTRWPPLELRPRPRVWEAGVRGKLMSDH